jgi:hypothetical protein
LILYEKPEVRGKLSDLEGGVDPGAKPVREVMPTVAKLVEEYLNKHAKPKKRFWRTDERLLNKEVIPLWGNLKANEIRKRDVILLLEGVVERGAPATSIWRSALT